MARGGNVFVLAHMSGPPSTLSLLETLAEPTRFRIVNCLSAAPLFVSELQALLDVPQPTVSRHLRVLREVGLVRDTPIGQFVLYRLRRPPEPLGRVLAAALDAARDEPALRSERASASTQGRRHPRQRTAPPLEGRSP
jgi:ArsR family transcriptional regulator